MKKQSYLPTNSVPIDELIEEFKALESPDIDVATPPEAILSNQMKYSSKANNIAARLSSQVPRMDEEQINQYKKILQIIKEQPTILDSFNPED